MRKRSVCGLVAVALCAPLAVGVAAAQNPYQPTSRTAASTPSSVSDVKIGLVRDPQLAAALGDVSADRIRANDSMLISFGTRNTLSDTVSKTRGIGAARRWIFETLSGYSRACGGCLKVEYDAAMMVMDRHPQKPTVNVVNVLAWLPGRDTTRVLVIGGHYDSCVCAIDRFDSTSDAPGADDDGSGSSAMIELARVFSKRYPRGLEATVIFALYAGEEQGLFGSTHLAERLHNAKYRVVAGMTNDIVGNVVADDGRTDSTSMRIYGADPDNGPSRELARYVWGLGSIYQPDFAVLPTFRLDRINRGGDHIPFVRAGDAGLRFTERLENYKRQHLPTDTFNHVNFGYVARVARLDAATVGSLASAPAVPDSASAARDSASGGQAWRLSWKPVPGAARYEVLVRRTTDATYTKVIDAGSGTSYLLADQLDDLWAGVRAVGANGHRSLAVVVPPPAFVTR
ncbi:MAG TPA: M28 family peptidase [Gemmatimonadaceae bacterium]|nr:M28 family peptidase [Gemmatimonadaceae bacterium]